MKHTISYKHLEGDAKVNKALDDCRFYLGDKFDQVVGILREIPELRHRVAALSWAGIEGYPAQVLAEWVMQPEELPRSAEEERRDEDEAANDDWHERRSHYNPGKPNLG